MGVMTMSVYLLFETYCRVVVCLLTVSAHV